MTVDRETLLLLTAYHDGALSAGEILAFERRLAAEPDLKQSLDELARLKTALSGTFASQPAAPEALRAKILAGVGGADRTTPEAKAKAVAEVAGPTELADRQPPLRQSVWPSRAALAASLAIGAVLGALIMPAVDRFGGGNGVQGRSVLDAVVDDHLRALAAAQPFEIASSDRHVVKPWFNGRTTIAPSAPDLADQGYPLIGGRVDVIDGQSVPSLVYRHDRHIISVTITPLPPEPQDGAEKGREGTVVESWRDGRLAYWAASDLNAADMRRFAELFRERTSSAP